MRPPCTGHPIFTNPEQADQARIDAALEMCAHCPLDKTCATQALASGDTLDGEYTAPASGVIQAGVVLDGSKRAALSLAEIAGATPHVPTRKPRRPTPTTCRDCGRAMVARDKSRLMSEQPLTHAAQGYCRICYARRQREGRIATRRKHQAMFGWPEQRGKKHAKEKQAS